MTSIEQGGGVAHTLAAHITQLSIPSQIEDYCHRFGLAVRITATRPGGPIRFVIDGAELSPGEAAEKYLGGFTAAHGRSAQDWAAFFSGPSCLSPAAVAFREAWQIHLAAEKSAAVAAIADITETIRQIYPDAASITYESCRNDDGDCELHLRGVFTAAGQRVAAIDDAQVDYADGWPVGGNDADAENLAYNQIDPMLTVLFVLDHVDLGDGIQALDLLAAGSTAAAAQAGSAA
jgi:hypothetical protein